MEQKITEEERAAMPTIREHLRALPEGDLIAHILGTVPNGKIDTRFKRPLRNTDGTENLPEGYDPNLAFEEWMRSHR